MRGLRIAAACSLAATGCLNVSTSAANPTALERQMLGAYEDLDRELVLRAATRGAAAGAIGDGSSLARAIDARALMLFDADDLAELLELGCVEEAEDARVAARPCPAATERPELLARRDRVVADENQARAAVIDYALEVRARDTGQAQLPAAEIDELRRALARLLRTSAARDARAPVVVPRR